MADVMKLTRFKDVKLADPFFDSLKTAYKEFPDWFAKKAEAPVYVSEKDDGSLQGFLYLKREDGVVTDVEPNLPAAKRLKVGTLKIVAHGTKLGERFVKKIFDKAIAEDVDEIYVTVFEEHAGLIRLFKRYGFQQHSTKTTDNGTELVFVRSLENPVGDTRRDYPLIHTADRNFYLLAIYPEYHTDLFPDSILNNEHADIVQDLSHTNTIHKVYVCSMNVGRVRPGDVLVMYRTSDKQGPAYYRSVATSVCVVEEVRSRGDFRSASEFVNYARPHSVFSREQLREWYESGKRLHVIRMTYNAAFRRRTTRGKLIEEVGLSDTARWDILPLTQTQFDRIMELGEINENLIID